jgi:hypothetical protein
LTEDQQVLSLGSNPQSNAGNFPSHFNQSLNFAEDFYTPVLHYTWNTDKTEKMRKEAIKMKTREVVRWRNGMKRGSRVSVINSKPGNVGADRQSSIPHVWYQIQLCDKEMSDTYTN